MSQMEPHDRIAAVLLTDLISRLPIAVQTISDGRAHAEAVRVVGLAVDAEPLSGAPALAVAGEDWVRLLPSPAHAQERFRQLRDDGCVGIVFTLGTHPPGYIVNVLRQLRLFSGTVASPRTTQSARAPRVEVHRVSTLRDQFQSVLDHEHARNQRRLEIVERLLTAIAEQEPITAVVEQLGKECNGAAILYDGAGTVIETTGPAPSHLLRTEIERRDLSHGVFNVGRWNAIGRDITIRTQSYVLVLASRALDVLDDHGPFILDSVARLLMSFQALEGFAVVQQVQNSGQVLRDIELGVLPGKERQIWDRLSEFGFAPFSALRFVVASTVGGHSLTHEVFDAIYRFAAQSGTPILVSENVRSGDAPPGFRLLVEDTETVDGWLEEMTSTLTIGVSQRFTHLSTVPVEARSAHLAEDVARHHRSNGRSVVVYVDGMSPADWLLARANSTRDRALLSSYAERLREQADLRKTLLVYFTCDMRIPAAAERLSIHPNTLRYRLAKIEEILGAPLNKPATIANLYLAFRDEFE